jgi:hypothetical protein
VTPTEPQTLQRRAWLWLLSLVPAVAAGMATRVYYSPGDPVLPALLVSMAAYTVTALALAAARSLMVRRWPQPSGQILAGTARPAHQRRALNAPDPAPVHHGGGAQHFPDGKKGVRPADATQAGSLVAPAGCWVNREALAGRRPRSYEQG